MLLLFFFLLLYFLSLNRTCSDMAGGVRERGRASLTNFTVSCDFKLHFNFWLQFKHLPPVRTRAIQLAYIVPSPAEFSLSLKCEMRHTKTVFQHTSLYNYYYNIFFFWHFGEIKFTCEMLIHCHCLKSQFRIFFPQNNNSIKLSHWKHFHMVKWKLNLPKQQENTYMSHVEKVSIRFAVCI